MKIALEVFQGNFSVLIWVHVTVNAPFILPPRNYVQYSLGEKHIFFIQILCLFLLFFTAIYFSCVMLMNSASVGFTVLVLVYHHRTANTHTMPKIVSIYHHE